MSDAEHNPLYLPAMETTAVPTPRQRELVIKSLPHPVRDEDDDEEQGFSGEQRWQQREDTFWNANPTVEALPPAIYRTAHHQKIGFCLTKHTVDTDKIVFLPDSPAIEVMDEVKRFWTLKPKFEKRGLVYKRGVLLWGPPGSGKTSTLMQLMTIVVEEHNGICIIVDHSQAASELIQMVRRIEPQRPIIALMEDLDAQVQREGDGGYLSLLDGEAQVSNIVFVATSNYPERLDRRFWDRPSRFDLIKQIGVPTAIARKAYLKAKEPSLSEDELDKWTEQSGGFSIAHLRELIVLCRCYEKPLDEAIARLREMRDNPPSSEKANDGLRKAGF